MRYATVLLALVIVATGCETLDTTGAVGTGPAINLLSTQEEVQLGQQMAVEVQKQTKPYPDAAIQAYVQQIGQRLVAVSPRQDVQYQIAVIDDPNTVNAFALPGGYLYVYTGLMKICDNEAELASVMAHEIAHVAAHHHGQMLTRQYGYNLLAGAILGQDPGALGQIVAGLVGQGFAMRFSRENEAQADQLGMDMMYSAGYQPVAMLTFMNKMVQVEQREGGGGRAFAIFASHPATADRLARLQALQARYPQATVAQAVTNREAYQQKVLSRLR